MGSNVKEHLRQALRLMMKPLIRLLISQGVSHSDFADAAKDVYVEVAIRHFEKDGKVNQSRAAILTGLTRKEVKNVIDRAMQSDSLSRNLGRPGRVLSGWHSDPAYVGPYGVPLEIPYESEIEGAPSFAGLVKTYSGDMASRPMLNELVRVGAVVELENCTYKAVRRDFEPEALSPELVERLGRVGHYFFSTAAANIEKRGQGTGYFDRQVFSEKGLSVVSLKEFDAYIKKRGQEFLEELDNWFVSKEKSDERTSEKKDTGLYMVHYVVNDEDHQNLRELLVERGLEHSSIE